MARLTAAAGLAWATLLVCVALGAGQAQPQANLAAWFPSGSLPPPVRIYSRQNDALNVAVRRGNVVFARADCSDDSQARFFYIPIHCLPLMDIQTLMLYIRTYKYN
jgi:hypothetical protein